MGPKHSRRWPRCSSPTRCANCAIGCCKKPETAAKPRPPPPAPRALNDPLSETPIAPCPSAGLGDGGLALGVHVGYGSRPCRAFAIRYRGQAHAYLNRCTHVAIEMDYQPGRFFDGTGQWLLCATHGAAYHPGTGRCAGGPCRGGLIKIALSENAGLVRWHTAHDLQPAAF